MPDTLRHLRVYLLGALDFDAFLLLQRAQVFQLGDEPGTGAVVLCEHPPLITVGRHGHPREIEFSREELAIRGWPMRWVARGGGCLLHVPGQLAIYPILPLARLGLSVSAYLEQLGRAVLAVLDDFGIQGQRGSGDPGIRVGNRPICPIGIGVRDGVSTFGAVLNIDADLTLCRHVHTGDPSDEAMTSLVRERRGPVRPALVRQRLVEHLVRILGVEQTEVLFHTQEASGHKRLDVGRAFTHG